MKQAYVFDGVLGTTKGAGSRWQCLRVLSQPSNPQSLPSLLCSGTGEADEEAAFCGSWVLRLRLAAGVRFSRNFVLRDKPPVSPCPPLLCPRRCLRGPVPLPWRPSWPWWWWWLHPASPGLLWDGRLRTRSVSFSALAWTFANRASTVDWLHSNLRYTK